MKFIVTGGAGFIGSHLTEYLLINGHKIIILDNFNDYYNPKIKQSNIQDIKLTMQVNNIDEKMLEIVIADIRDKYSCSEIITQDIDCMIHLAAMAGVRPSIEMPEYYYDVNINGTLNLLELCKLSNIKKFIFASSSSVYGNNKKVPFSEKDSVDLPISPYAATKKSGELLCHVYHSLYDIDIACLRFFTVYGPRQRPDLAIHKFTKMIYNDEVLPFFGDGTSRRDYTYIDDIIDGITKSIDWISQYSDVYEIFNLGESHTITLKQMISVLEREIGKSAKINRMPSQLGDVDVTFADIAKSKNMLSYDPKTTFEDGIKKFIQWYKTLNKIKGVN